MYHIRIFSARRYDDIGFPVVSDIVGSVQDHRIADILSAEKIAVEPGVYGVEKCIRVRTGDDRDISVLNIPV